MLLFLLFCPMFEAVKVSEKIAVATLTMEFMEPWIELICLANPQPEVWLWKQPIYPPQTRFIPNYEVLNDTKKVTKMINKKKKQIILLDLNHMSDRDLQYAMTIKNKFKDSAIVMSQDPCLRGPTTSKQGTGTSVSTLINYYKCSYQSITVQNYKRFESDYEKCNFRNVIKKVWFEISTSIVIFKISLLFRHFSPLFGKVY